MTFLHMGTKGPSKDQGRRDEDVNLHRSMSSQNMYCKFDNGKKGLSSSSSRYERLDDDHEISRSVRKLTDYDVEVKIEEKGSAKDVDENGSRSGHEFARGNRVTAADTGRVRSPGQSLGEMRRPSSRQSEDLPIESGNNSEMAEGELEPDTKPIPVVKHLAEEDADNGLKFNEKKFNNYKLVEAKSFGDRDLLSEAKLQLDQGMVHEEKTETEVSEATHTVVLITYQKAITAEKSSSGKLKDEQVETEPLELSLSLLSVLLANNSQNTIQATSSRNTVQALSSPSHARSVQSFASSSGHILMHILHHCRSQGTTPDYWNEKRQFTRDKVPGDVQDEKWSIQGSGDDFMEPIGSMIISEPIHTEAREFNEMTHLLQG
ncbi:hypothetical protein POM88_036518 [Heracleum sosnowskyi]|uniref:Uncharacterized protein n=1 Tax=Heracleum sosnowskyi TaxID=360622 RepID=A0AAD8MED7_9APIA|nr:hypothetical protein POM88_036518 [Heracleum sosnowskyi]